MRDFFKVAYVVRTATLSTITKEVINVQEITGE